MRIMRQPPGQQGFSLIELLVALTIFSVGLLGVAGMQTIATKKTSISYNISVATSLAKEALEDLMARDPADPLLNPATTTTGTYASNVSVAGAGNFTITYTATPNSPSIGTTWIVISVQTSSGGISVVRLGGYKRVV
jgi:type IV pilus assembly protein PilV